uniref:Uncharacterized protein n=1 Tax=Rhizophora mucronata TaxID=61149 RepID=A0A2P2PXD2_RHIMU
MISLTNACDLWLEKCLMFDVQCTYLYGTSFSAS